MTIDFLTLAILVLASYRVTRFIVADTLLGVLPGEDPDHPRGTGWRRVLDEFGYDEQGDDRSLLRGKLADLLTCPWCAGVWVSVAAVCLWTRTVPWELGIQGWFVAAAVAGGQGFVASRMNA